MGKASTSVNIKEAKSEIRKSKLQKIKKATNAIKKEKSKEEQAAQEYEEMRNLLTLGPKNDQ